MRVFKATYQDKKTGVTKPAHNWYIEIRDHMSIARRFAGFSDKNQSLALGRKITKLVNSKLSGEPLDRELSEWLDCISGKLRNRLHDIGLLNGPQAAAKKLLKKHLEDFRQFLQTKGNTPEHCRLAHYRAERICNGCKFVYWNDISASDIQFYIANLRERGEISQKTSNYYLQAIKQFCNWMLKDRRTSGETPLKYLDTIKVTNRIQRRSLTPDELSNLLKTTETAPKSFGMEGHERAILYRFAVYTGLRANEIRNLTISSFDFNNCTVNVKATSSKRRREDVLPLRKDTIITMSEFFRGKTSNVKAFNLPSKYNMADMLRADCKIAEINYEDDGQGRLDFHSLRHTTGSLLAANGVHPKIAQSIMRHSDINLTMLRYTHIFRGQESQAVESLPDFSKRIESNLKYS
ncbi:MAG TPA: site-specific integrase [Sedimentisphaerales bacterium]|nr:site-specific integrase [Sedimentisphaerales bacterium]